uniref:Uncharacterized protein n=1 Tax=Amphora coffeiformis TaxID=265554 RepID=A0A7S3LAW4_9STRA|eukprot:scaffold17205_cov186-Amphora_coffeaeformis.AAC.8
MAPQGRQEDMISLPGAERSLVESFIPIPPPYEHNYVVECPVISDEDVARVMNILKQHPDLAKEPFGRGGRAREDTPLDSNAATRPWPRFGEKYPVHLRSLP